MREMRRPIRSYFDQLREMAGDDERLREAFLRATGNTSTFYRARLDDSLRLDTARKVAVELHGRAA